MCVRDGRANRKTHSIPVFVFQLIWTADLLQQSSGTLCGMSLHLFTQHADILTLDEVLSFETASLRQQWADYTWAISGLFFGPRRDHPLEEAITLEASHYLNHSCSANVGFASDTSIVTMRDIEPGEMISNDYAMTEHLIGFFPGFFVLAAVARCSPRSLSGFPCKCGSPNCRGEVSVNDWRRPELQERYKGYFTSQVQQLIDTVTADFSPMLQKAPFTEELRVGLQVLPHPKPEVGKGKCATLSVWILLLTFLDPTRLVRHATHSQGRDAHY
jgi:hypothetical protein